MISLHTASRPTRTRVFTNGTVGALLATGMLLPVCGHGQTVRESTPLVRAVTKAPPVAADAPAWGSSVASGFQMGAWLSDDSRSACCLIRNAGSARIRYQVRYTEELGYWEDVTVWARPTGTSDWVRLPRDRFVSRGYAGIGFHDSPLLPIPGDKIFQRTDFRKKGKDLYEDTRFIAVPEQTNPASETDTIVWRGTTYRTPRIIPYTFSVFLKDFEWPEDWAGAVEIQVEHRMHSASSQSIKYQDYDQPLRSGTLTLPAETVSRLRVRQPTLPIPVTVL